MSLKNVDWKNLLERAAWTFVEGFLLAIPIISPANIEEFLNGSWKLVVAGAIGAGLSAVKTVIIDFIRQYKAKQLADKTEAEIEADEYGDLTEYFDKTTEEKDEKK